MKLSSLCTAAAVIALTAHAAHAERARTTAATSLRARPGEAARAVTRVKAGTEVDVLRRKGRWLYVEAGGKRGWITRTTVDGADADADAPDTPRRRARRWRSRGDSWAASDSRAGARTVQAPVTDEPEVEVEAPPPPLPAFTVRATAGLGVRSVGMDFTSDVREGLGNYVIAAQAAAVGAGGELRWRVAGRVLVGADLHYGWSYASPGIRYQRSSGEMAEVSFSTHELDGGVIVGVRLGERAPIDVYARAGAHYEAFLVGETANLGMLPSESLSGATAGVGIDLPRLDDAIAVSAGVDVLLGGARDQTEGLADGEVVESSALWGRASLTYHLDSGFDLDVRYHHGRARTSWAGGSDRVAGVEGAERADAVHSFVIGLGRAL